MRTFSHTSQFKKDVKRADKRGWALAKLKVVLDLLIEGNPLPKEYKDHPLRGDFIGSRDCHIEPDWILSITFPKKIRMCASSALAHIAICFVK